MGIEAGLAVGRSYPAVTNVHFATKSESQDGAGRDSFERRRPFVRFGPVCPPPCRDEKKPTGQSQDGRVAGGAARHGPAAPVARPHHLVSSSFGSYSGRRAAPCDWDWSAAVASFVFRDANGDD